MIAVSAQVRGLSGGQRARGRSDGRVVTAPAGVELVVVSALQQYGCLTCPAAGSARSYWAAPAKVSTSASYEPAIVRWLTPASGVDRPPGREVPQARPHVCPLPDRPVAHPHPDPGLR